ncbi:cytochrome P450 6B5 [Manduca sexta]|uniref:cytochrome P450 6B5 n=1 Tax=Manduca sexta TaxID=7130 RepID=UPI00188FBC83|nr:cytochrome P450 6B5 [Manduca sexta]
MFLVLFLFISIIIFYFYATRNHDYWSKRNIKHDRPLPFFGNHLPNVLLRRSAVELGLEYYNKYKEEKIVGYYRGNTPELIIKDPDIIKQVLAQDFMHFYSRATLVKGHRKSLLYNLFLVNGDHWRLLRHRFSSAFSVSKIRAMFPLIEHCAEKLHKLSESLVDSNGDVYAWNLMARFSMEIIGSCGFGVDLDTIANKNDNFIKLANKFFDKTKLQTFMLNFDDVFNISSVIPGFYSVKKEFEKAIIDITMSVREQRNFKPSGRNDFMDILLEMEAMEKLEMESLFTKNPDGSPATVELEMDVYCIAAQVFVFLLAGFDTSAHVTSVLLHQLAYHQEIQRNIQKEIDEVLSRYDNKLCYDAVNEMSLLSMSLNESIRILPPAGINRRKCTKKYTIPGTNVTIDPGVTVFIPTQAIHLDPKYYDNPLEFRPERFSPEASKDRHRFVFMPFGEGPRKCPGNRLGQLQSMAGLASLLRSYNVEPSAATKREHTFKKSSFLIQIIEGGLPLRLTRRNK